ncbi:NHL repeat-containing protein [Bdellovibrio bacteriovorus]|uniref:NHL repeat-containing protein n=1 Tax=Bdellovibrio bacteriovorus TaxID=959 RepID=UPI0021D262B5|nr:NHL repeat-containing protein [Bdellovibrio bacteriovorus]UXR64465.1 NHL repeat-containing protein [Bdellovibrio bacteriovorus]
MTNGTFSVWVLSCAVIFNCLGCTLDFNLADESAKLPASEDEILVKPKFQLSQKPFGEEIKSELVQAPDGRYVSYAPVEGKMTVYNSRGQQLVNVQIKPDSQTQVTVNGLHVTAAGIIYLSVDQTSAQGLRRQYVEKFSLSGTRLGIFKEYAEDSGVWPTPGRILSDSQNRVYIALNELTVIQLYDSAGTLIRNIGDTIPWHILGYHFHLSNFILDQNGSLYTFYKDSNVYHKLDVEANTLTSGGTWPRQLANSDIHSIMYFSSVDPAILLSEVGTSGAMITAFKANSGSTIYYYDGSTSGTAFTGSALALAGPPYSTGAEYTDPATDFIFITNNGRTLKFILNDSPPKFVVPGMIESPIGLAFDKLGNLYVSTPTNIEKHNYYGLWDITFGTGSYAMAFDSANTAFFPDMTGVNIRHFSTNGSDQGGFTLTNATNFIQIDSLDVIYVADPADQVIQKVSLLGTPQGTLGNGLLTGPSAFALTSGGVVVLDHSANTPRALVKIKNDNTLEWEIAIGDIAGLGSPWGIAVDASGNIYISDIDNHQIVKLSPTGELLKSFGHQGAALGEFNVPTGLAIDTKGNLYVADMGNHRVQKFSPEGLPLTE